MIIVFKNTKIIKKFYFVRRITTLLNTTKTFKSLPLCEHTLVQSFVTNLNRQCQYFYNDNLIDEPKSYIIDELLTYDELARHRSIKNSLYPDSKDPHIVKLNECASIQEVLNVIKEDYYNFQSAHVVQAILVLWDLQKMFIYAHQLHNFPDNTTIDNQLSQLINHAEFKKLLTLLQEKCKEMDVEALSCALLYLNKIGLSMNHEPLSILVTELRRFSNEDISLSALSRLSVSLSNKNNLSIYFLLKDSIPIMVKALDNCESAEDFKLITICLTHLPYIVTDDLLKKYEEKTMDLIKNNILTIKHSRTILKALLFLNNSGWNDRCTVLISRLMMLLKNNLHTLHIYDFFTVSEILHKNQEPGELLTEMHRCGSRLLLVLNEDQHMSINVRLKLLSCVVSFSSPKQRLEYEKSVTECIGDISTLSSIFDLLKIITYVKPSAQLCDQFWEKVLKINDIQGLFKDSGNLLTLSQKYINFSNDLNYRNHRFEQKMLSWIYKDLKTGITSLLPSKYALASAFILSYENGQHYIDNVIKGLVANCKQFNYPEYLCISKGLKNAERMVSKSQFKEISYALDKAIEEKLSLNNDASRTNFILKSCVYRKCYSNVVVEKLLRNLECRTITSSNEMRNIIFSLHSIGGLVPNVIDNITDYVLRYKDNLLGFNAERVVYLCYFLAYLPNNSDQLFQTVIDIILRDQERMTGLSYIQASLSLAFFHKLPNSFIKNIFNVAFLEKIDAELSTCYFKDVYPFRVRRHMMELNRAVCLDYPEANVPWFHQKYIELLQSKADNQKWFAEIETNFKSYLLKIVGNSAYIMENYYTPYGYHVNFLLNLNNGGQFLQPDEKNTNKIAIILLKPNAYTTINVQLKGRYELKKRHLEILGYRVLPINVNEWNLLICGEDKLEYINKLIWPKIVERNELCSYFERC